MSKIEYSALVVNDTTQHEIFHNNLMKQIAKAEKLGCEVEVQFQMGDSNGHMHIGALILGRLPND